MIPHYRIVRLSAHTPNQIRREVRRGHLWYLSANHDRKDKIIASKCSTAERKGFNCQLCKETQGLRQELLNLIYRHNNVETPDCNNSDDIG